MDRFSAGYLGPYGNTWINTPALNRFASQATLLETAITDSPVLEEVYQSYWRGCHAALKLAVPGDSLPQVLSAGGVTTALLTDCPALASDASSDGFSQRIALELDQPTEPVDDVEQTQLGQLFAETAQWIRLAQEPFLLWVHARALGHVWDAPMTLRAQFADIEDPSPSATVVAPNLVLDTDYDPDELLGLVHAYAGQVAVLDLCLAALIDAVDQRLDDQRTLVIVTAPRGFPLGEHGFVGACGDQLNSEVLQVPCLVRHPDPAARNRRCHTLVQPPDLYATLLDWFGQAEGIEQPYRRSLLPALVGESKWTRELACSALGQQLAIRTPIWFLVSGGDQSPQLFVKPDDRWEVNEVADRCLPITDQLCGVLRQISDTGLPADLQLPLELVEEE